MPFRICKTFSIESGHILSKHPGKCRFPHGHSRTVEIVLAADQLDANDMVCDFKVIKTALNDFIESWDHALCLNTEDPNFAFYQKTYGAKIIPFTHADPTSELMAKAIFDELNRTFWKAASKAAPDRPAATGLHIECVRITETSSSWAEYSE
jgi:6-pyruvoyltetrahydropterin/6-carboxytetrahydropterin synthase